MKKQSFKTQLLFIALLTLITSCSHWQKFSEDSTSGEDKSRIQFVIQEKKLTHNLQAEDFSTAKLDIAEELDFFLEGNLVQLKNVLKEHEKLPSYLETKIIAKKIKLNIRDRFLLKINHESGPQFVLPYFTNAQNVQMPIKLMFEKNSEDNKTREKNFLLKIPEAGEYVLYLISFGPKNTKFSSSYFLSQKQNDQKPSKSNCSEALAYNLRHCIKSECSVNMTEAFTPVATPPEDIFYHYKINPKNDFCEIQVSSNIDQDKKCVIPKEFNYFIQDCAYPLKDPEFTKKLNTLNQNFYKAKTNEELQANSLEVQQLWIREYPISLMCSKELDFQLPDLDLLMQQYCKEQPIHKKNNLISWKEDLEAKIALKQASLNFKSITLAQENKQDNNNQYIQFLEDMKTKNHACFKQNNLKVCQELAEFHLSQKDFLSAAEANGKACDLGNALSCQKAGLNFSQAKLRKNARKYEIQGCNLKDSISCYNVACGYCIDNNKKEALKYFKKHLQLGAEEPMHILFDPTIQCIKNSPEFINFKNKALAP
jgi:hypothetical protein